MDIRIIDVPLGEAPEAVRQAWVGLVLPMAPGESAPRWLPDVGVLSGPRGLFGQLWGLLTGRFTFRMQYLVKADAAVEILARAAPEAAAWWRETLPDLIGPGKILGFAANVCEAATGSAEQPADVPIRVRVVPTYADYRRARWNADLRALSIAGPVIGLLLLLIVCLTSNLGRDVAQLVERVSLYWPALALAAAFYLLELGDHFLLVPRRFWRSRELSEPRSYEFSRSGIRVAGSNFRHIKAWKNIHRVRRTGSLVVFDLLTEHTHYVVPIQAFEDEDQWKRFVRLCRTRIRLCRLGAVRSIRFLGSTNATAEDMSGVNCPDEPCGDAIRIRFVPSFADHLGGSKRFILAAIGASIFILGVAAFILLPWNPVPSGNLSRPSLAWLFVGFWVASSCFMAGMVVLLLLSRWFMSREAHEPRTCVFKDSGFEFEADSFTIELSWALVKKVRRKGSRIVLFTESKKQHLLPRNAFSDEDWSKFRRLVEAKVPKCRLP